MILSGGETGVRVNGAGRGGRNTTYLAALLDQLGPEVDIAGLAADTDGVDGSGGAGAWLAVSSFIERSDTHVFFATLGAALERRPTLTNVNDFRAILVGASRI